MAAVIENRQFRKLLQAYPKRAITILYRFYHKRLQQVAYSLVRDKDLSKDIVQETFQNVWKNRHQISADHEQPILDYLIKAVRYKCLSHFRAVSRHNRHHIIYLQDQVSKTLPYHEINADDFMSELRTIIASLSKRERECFVMNTEEDMSVRQIANKLKISHKTVEMFLTSARKKVRQYVRHNF